VKGRKPKPTALKLLNGNAGRRPLNEAEPMPKVGEPAPLNSLTPEALAHFRDLTGKLTAVRVLTINDGPALSALAQSIADYEQATSELATQGKVITTERGAVKNPWTTIQKEAFAQMQKGFTEFGLTPSSRSKIIAAPASTEDDSEALFG
jgi:P27 family predicted phage terminase small subunit